MHRSYLVNLERVTKIEPYGKDDHVVVLSGGAYRPVSRSGYLRRQTRLEQKAQSRRR